VDVTTGVRIEYADTRDKYKLTKKVPYDYNDLVPCQEETHSLRERILKRLYPEEALRIEVMKRFAVIMFTTRNADKMIMMLYGNGNIYAISRNLKSLSIALSLILMYLINDYPPTDAPVRCVRIADSRRL
jgi:hypothetical protein